tara:strand:- start:2553 stop:2834 length:282 start_codon:yes stop_codon:yes gene_type:complete
MNEEDMIRMIESGEQLPDYCQEEFDNIIFCKIKEQQNGKVSIKLSERVFTSYGRSQKVGISRLHDNKRTTRRYTKLQSQGSRPKIHSSRIPKK